MAVYTDNFQAYNTGNIAGQGNWLACLNTMSVVDSSGDKRVLSSVLSSECSAKRSETFGNDQYAQIRIDGVVGGGFVGVAVRAQGSGATAAYYCYYASSAERFLCLIKDGAYVGDICVHRDVGVVAGDILKLTIIGNTLTCYLNGVVDTEMGAAVSPATGSAGVYVDTRIASGGTPGITGYSTTSNTADDWEGGTIDSSTYNGKLYIYNGSAWVPKPLELYQPSAYSRKPLKAYYNGQWNLIQSF